MANDARAALTILAFAATIPLSNWMIGNVGICSGQGPCLLPVAPGLMAPSPVILIGLALVLRDAVHRIAGPQVALLAIAGGAVLSAFVAPPALAAASGTAFLLSELADFAVYVPLQRKRLYLAVLLSGLVGAVVDSAAFLWLAFGNLDFMAGQVVGKVWASLAALPIIAFARRQAA